MMVSWLLGAVWGGLAIVAVECLRDVYHLASHQWPLLYRHHAWHHRVFRRDLTCTRPDIYTQAQWHNDLPECLIMLGFSLGMGGLSLAWLPGGIGAMAGVLYTLVFLVSCVGRGWGSEWVRRWTDLTHLPGPFRQIPGQWFVNRPYHWRHHFDDDQAYFCSTLTILDRVMGTALSLKGKKIGVTGASGTMGRALLQALQDQGAKVTALTSSHQSVVIGEAAVPTVRWQTGSEADLTPVLEKLDILILNHGINVGGARTPEAIAQSYEVNVWSSWRLLNLFLATVQSNEAIATKEVWVNTSEAEVSPAFSPLYELSKRTLGDLVTLQRLDAPCIIRKLVLGPFKSNLNPVGVMNPERVARAIVRRAKGDQRNIIVTINPLTYLAFPLKETLNSWYFRWFSRPALTETLAETRRSEGSGLATPEESRG